jgi:hypothetical protein
VNKTGSEVTMGYKNARRKLTASGEIHPKTGARGIAALSAAFRHFFVMPGMAGARLNTPVWPSIYSFKAHGQVLALNRASTVTLGAGRKQFFHSSRSALHASFSLSCRSLR